MVTAILVLTAMVVMVKAGDTVVPPATVTDAGTVALGSLLVRATTTPPAGAGPFKLTVPDVETPPRTDDGEQGDDVEAVNGPTGQSRRYVTPL